MFDPEAPYGLKRDGTPRGKPGPKPGDRPWQAIAANCRSGIERAVNDPEKLARAAAIVRMAIQHGKLTYADLAPVGRHATDTHKAGSPVGS